MPSTPIPSEVLRFQRAIRSLRLVFWGGFVTLLGFKLSVVSGGEARSVQLLPDFVGLAIVLPGVVRLAGLKVSSLYETLMSVVLGVCSAWALGSLFFTFRPELMSRLGSVVSFVPLLAVLTALCFAVAMLDLSRTAGARRSVAAWRRASALIVALMIVPRGLAWGATAMLQSDGEVGGVSLAIHALAALLSFGGWLAVFWAYTVMSREGPGLPASAASAEDEHPLPRVADEVP